MLPFAVFIIDLVGNVLADLVVGLAAGFHSGLELPFGIGDLFVFIHTGVYGAELVGIAVDSSPVSSGHDLSAVGTYYRTFFKYCSSVFTGVAHIDALLS